jgi:hypothetical protein
MERGAHGPTPAATVDADEAFRSYEFGLVSLARLGELIGTDRQGAIEFVESRGLVVQDGPTSIEEARRDISVARSLRAK